MKNKQHSIPADGLAGLKQNFSKDALSGFLVFLLALPLSLGIAKASDFPAIFGLVTAIIGGIIVSIIAGSPLTIKGPAAGLIAIAAGAVHDLGGDNISTGWHMALGAIVVAGIVQILFGVLKLGKLSNFFSDAAIHGMLAAIGLIVMSKQIHNLLGINPKELKGKEPLELFAMIPESLSHENAHLTEIGITALAIMIGFSLIKNKFIRKIPAPLVVLIISIPLGIILDLKHDNQVGNFADVKVGSLVDAFTPETKMGDYVSNGFLNAEFTSLSTHPGKFIIYVVLFALIGSIESLLTVKAIDGLDPHKRKSNTNKDLIAVGIGNTLAGLLGGLPMISEVARSSNNVSNGGQTRWANFFHGTFLLIALLVAVPLIEMIPNTALAAMLIFVGFKLAHPKEFIHMYHVGKEQLFIFVTTIVVTLSTDLLIGVGTGLTLELIINLINGAKLKNLFSAKTEIIKNTDDNYTIKLNSDLVFTSTVSFQKALATIPPQADLTIDVTNAGVIDHSSVISLNSFKDSFESQDGNATIVGLDQNHSLLGHDVTSTRIMRKYE